MNAPMQSNTHKKASKPWLTRIRNFVNYPPKSLDKRKHAEYFGIFLSSISGIFANVVLLALFMFQGYPLLWLLSISAMLLWSTAAYCARLGKFKVAVYIALFEMLMHVGVMVSVIGTDYGMQMILWSAIAFATLNTSQKPYVTTSIGFLVVIEFVLLYAYVPAQTQVRPYAGNEDIIFLVMTAMTALPLLFVLLRLKSIQIKQRKRLQKQIYNDELTGLYNRHFVYELLDYELEMMKKARSPFCLCFADVDHFKQVNDTYGHQVGDEVLIGIADVLRNNLRKSDVICRWGGEEFVVVLPRCSIEQAPKVIEKVTKALENTSLSSKNLSVTLSLGIVTLSNEEPLEVILKRADDLLYLAKQNGRNRIEVETSHTEK